MEKFIESVYRLMRINNQKKNLHTITNKPKAIAAKKRFSFTPQL